MLNQDLIASIQKQSNILDSAIERAFDGIKNIVSKQIKDNKKSIVPGLGTFSLDGKNILFVPDKILQEKISMPLGSSIDKKTDISNETTELSFKEFEEELENTPNQGTASTIPYLDLSSKIIPKEILSYIPEHIARRYQIVPVEEKDKDLTVSMIDPEDQEAIELIKKRTGMNLKVTLCTIDDLNHIIDQYSGITSEVNELVQTSDESLESMKEEEEEVAQEVEASEHAPAAKVVDSIFKRAVREKASDIHIEPMEDEVIVRFRIDGVLRKIVSLPKMLHPSVISRIKILSNLKIDELRLPQDGRFQIRLGTNKIDFRISTLPTVNGEKVVARILDKSAGILSLEDLGMRGSPFETLKENITKSHGMVLVTGPTGSGKTTTLYAVIDRIKDIAINIVTLEDPVEYRLPGINQCQLNSDIGYTFASGLRAILRQDPNVVMVGEIRDYDTATIAVHAALTGHVVLSTLHTNNAAGAIPRLIDMNIEPFLLTSSVNAIVAQRLCRKICPKCKEETKLDDDLQKSIKEILSDLPSTEKKEIINKSTKFYKGHGCDACGNSGYKGRIGIYEVLNVTDKIKQIVSERTTTDTIEQTAMSEGMITMKQDGILKALDGLTTIQEVWRVTKD